MNQGNDDNTPDHADASGTGASLPFNPLTGDLQDLRASHIDCWLWPQISPEISRLDDAVTDAHTFVAPLLQGEPPEWAMQAALGIARSNLAIYQHAERYDSYVAAARSLWTTHIPKSEPTLTDAQIYALLCVYESRMAATLYCEIARGIEDEMALVGISHEEEEDIGWLRTSMAGWERDLWHYAAQQTGTAEKFLLMAQYCANEPEAQQLRKAEAQVVELQRRARAAEENVQAYRQGRQKGAVSKLTKALAALIRDTRSRDFDVIMRRIAIACNEGPIEGIQFEEYRHDFVWYRDVMSRLERTIKTDTLKRRLNRISDI